MLMRKIHEAQSERDGEQMTANNLAPLLHPCLCTPHPDTLEDKKLIAKLIKHGFPILTYLFTNYGITYELDQFYKFNFMPENPPKPLKRVQHVQKRQVNPSSTEDLK